MEYLVFDVGGTAIKYALMNDELEMLEKGSVPTPLDTLENFLEVIKSIYNRYSSVDGIAMSYQAYIIRKHTKCRYQGH